MQIIVVVIDVKFQMLIAVTNWFQMKSIAYLLKRVKSSSFCYLPILACRKLAIIAGTDSFKLMVLSICLLTLCHAASTAS